MMDTRQEPGAQVQGSGRHRILVLDSKMFNPNRYLAVALRHAFARHPQVETAELATYRNALTVAEALRPTLLILFGGEEIDHFIIRKLTRIAKVSAIWFTEDPYELTRNQASTPFFDLVFTNDRSCAQSYRNGIYLPLAASEPFHFVPLSAQRRRYDLFFAGTAWPNRISMFEQLFSLNSGLRLKLFMPPNPFGALSGTGWESASIQQIHVSAMDFARFCAHSAATLYLTRDFSLSPGSPSMTTSPGPRFFEAALAGGVQVYQKGTVDLPDGFVAGETAFPYATLEELIGLIERFRDDKAAWMTTAKACQDLILDRHCYHHRAATILSLLS